MSPRYTITNIYKNLWGQKLRWCFFEILAAQNILEYREFLATRALF